MKTPPRPKIAVIGAGWAGLSAAVRLATAADICLFEAGRNGGGRARGLENADGWTFLDNGQHLLLGGYHAVLALLNTIGVRANTVFFRQPLTWHMAGGPTFQAARLPAPWHILIGILRARHIHGSEKRALLWQMRCLKSRRDNTADTTVAAWLAAQNCPQRLARWFWQPLTLSALNTPITDASLNTLRHTLSDSVWGARGDADFLLPRVDLTRLLVSPALDYLRRHGVSVRNGSRVGTLVPLPDGRIRADDQTFDAVIPAVAPYHLAALLPENTPDTVKNTLAAYRYHAITTVYLRYRETFRLPEILTGIPDGTAHWLIDRRYIDPDCREITAVISASDTLGIDSTEEWIRRVHRDILGICPYLGLPETARVITVKRATPAHTPPRSAPDMHWLHHHRIYPAGDYLHPRYPATLEAAVQHGGSTAEQLLADLEFNRLSKGKPHG